MLKRSSGLSLFILLVWLACFPAFAKEKEPSPNLIANPEFKGTLDSAGVPEGWQRDPQMIPGVERSRVYFFPITGHPGKLLAMEGRPDRTGRVWCQINNIRPHTDYLLEFSAFRPQFTNGVYLEVEIFGQRHLINQHFSYGRIQPIFLRINSGLTRGTTRLAIANPHREVLAFGSPSLREAGIIAEAAGDSQRLPNFFPVGIYAASPDDLAEIRAAGFNAVQSYDSKPENIRLMAAASARLGLKYLPNYRGEPTDISRALGGRPELLGFYIEDEPEGRSVPPKTMKALKEALKRDHPGVLTAVAMLRPQMVAAYREASDVFLIDPYPVPHMPMTWLSDSLEEAARHVPKERLWAVIQAFGGEQWAKHGWPRRPTHTEMRCLTYLAVVHGAYGLFYFSYPEIRSDPASWEGLKKITAELRRLRTWLVLPNEPNSLRLEMISPFKADASGEPAIHYCLKNRGSEHLLVLVNVIEHPVGFYLQGFPPQLPWLTELFQQEKSVIQDGAIKEQLGPYEVRIYSYTQEN